MGDEVAVAATRRTANGPGADPGGIRGELPAVFDPLEAKENGGAGRMIPVLSE